MTKKKAYFIGIVGKATASIAKALHDQGWEVSGSDEPFGGPALDYLEKNDISVLSPYSADNVPLDAQLVVIGGGALTTNPNNPEYLQAKSLGLKIVSYPQLFEEMLIEKTSVVVAGTYGKTSITALITWVLKESGFDPSYMIGGFPLNFTDGVNFTSSEYSVVEGDEHPTLNYDPRPKFAFYHPTQLLLTSAMWDHRNVYPTEASYIKVFQDLVASLPSNGRVVAKFGGENMDQVLPFANCHYETYSLEPGADWGVADLEFGKDTTRFRVVSPRNNYSLALETSLIGRVSVENILGAVTLCQGFGVEKNVLQQAVKSFAGVRERLEILGEVGGVTLVRDYAHSPIKIKAAIEALRTRYPKEKHQILVVLDAHSSTLRDRRCLPGLGEALSGVEGVCLTKVLVLERLSEERRARAFDILNEIKKDIETALYCPKNEQLENFIRQYSHAEDVIVFMSSGGQEKEIEITKKILAS